jgi:hypothetical protein
MKRWLKYGLWFVGIALIIGLISLFLGFLLPQQQGIMFLIVLLLGFLVIAPGWAFQELLSEIGLISGNCDYLFCDVGGIYQIISSIIIWFIIGVIMGLIVDKIKKSTTLEAPQADVFKKSGNVSK